MRSSDPQLEASEEYCVLYSTILQVLFTVRRFLPAKRTYSKLYNRRTKLLFLRLADREEVLDVGGDTRSP